MAKNEYLLISRGQWDADADPAAVQAAVDRFYVWYEQGLHEGRFKRGSRLENRGRLVSRQGVTDGPFAEAKELIGGYWFIVAQTLDDAAAIAAENPCIAFGLSFEIRPLEAQRASVDRPANETPAAWKQGPA